MFQKHFNPVRAVKYYILFSGMDVDEKSFENVEEELAKYGERPIITRLRCGLGCNMR